jgi:long-chain acyl-CoA synthetase
MSDKRLFEYLYEQLERFPLEKAFGHKVNGQWTYYSTQQMVDTVNRLSMGLISMGLQAGDKVATVVYKTSPEWIALDYAMMQIGVLNVPMYPTISPREYTYILNESEAKFCIVGEGDLFQKVSDAKQNVASLTEILTFHEHPTARNWKVLLSDKEDTAELERRKAAVKPDDLLTIIYTSGTTGNPKGVMLTHRNIVFNVDAVHRIVPIVPGDRVLSFLPVSHVFERVAVYFFTKAGISVSFTGTDNLGGEDGDLRAIKPHFFTTVPRLLEKVYEKIVSKGMELTGLKRALFFDALSLAEQWDFDTKYSGWNGIRWAIAQKLIFSKWREALGGNIKAIVTGASACPMKIMRVFNSAGIPVREAYGMTEASPGISINGFAPNDVLLGSVGSILDGIDVRIDTEGSDYRPDEGEILIKGPGVMLGYYKQPEKTDEMIREIKGEQWLATGDVGKLVQGPNGKPFLKITDRKKELLKTSGGKYVAPTPIESILKEHRLVDQAMIVGENLKFVSALIVPSTDGLKEWCQKNNIAWTSVDDAVQNPKVINRFDMLVERVNPNFGHAEQIKKFILLTQTWEAVKEDGSDAELTPSMKLKRRVIMEKFKVEIETMYQE